MPEKTPSQFGRTPWDLARELLSKRSFLVWACVIGWGMLSVIVWGWYNDALPARGKTPVTSLLPASYYLHWSIHPVPAEKTRCQLASLSAQKSSGAKDIEEHDEGESEVFVVGVEDEFVSAVGCAGLPNMPISVVFVAGPEQTATQNKQRQLRKLLDAHLPRY